MAPAEARRGSRAPATSPTRRRSTRWSPACDAIVHLGGVSVERPVRADPRGQHRRRLQPLRSGAPARRQARRLRELEPRHRLLPAGRGHRRRDADAARRPLRPVARPSARTWRASTSTATASRPCACASARRSPSRKDRRMLAHLAQLRRPRAPGRRRLTAPVVGHTVVYGMSANRDAGGTTRRPRTSASAAGQLRSRFAPRSRRSRRSRPTDPTAIYQGGAFVAQGPFGD